MKKIERYNPVHCHDCADMRTADDGNWVSYRDYIEVVKLLDSKIATFNDYKKAMEWALKRAKYDVK